MSEKPLVTMCVSLFEYNKLEVKLQKAVFDSGRLEHENCLLRSNMNVLEKQTGLLMEDVNHKRVRIRGLETDLQLEVESSKTMVKVHVALQKRLRDYDEAWDAYTQGRQTSFPPKPDPKPTADHPPDTDTASEGDIEYE